MRKDKREDDVKDIVDLLEDMWYRSLAEQGDASAQNTLGIMYYNGDGVPQDYQEAMKWYRLAAEQGHAGAQFNLGVMYASGKGVPQDVQVAVKWWRLAAEQGHAGAQWGRVYQRRWRAPGLHPVPQVD